MTIARRDIVNEGAEGVYHCISRCVRRAFLCGEDSYTGQSYEHRKEWIRSRLRDLAGLFGIEVGGYTVMSNHLHVILRTRPDVVAQWSDTEVARRWSLIFPGFKDKDGCPNILNERAVRLLAANPERIAELRGRLSSVSWFMRCLNEHIARRANREDECKGRFWEGRFKCQALLDEGAILACMTYVDLNPIRAGLANTPESSAFTSAYDRIMARQDSVYLDQGAAEDRPISRQVELEGERDREESDPWLCPLNDGAKARNRAFFSLSTEEYLALLDWTGRQLRSDKKGAIPPDMQPILDRLNVNSERWLDTVNGYGRLFHRVVGQVESMLVAARQAGQNWFHGLRSGQKAFLRI